MREFTKREFLKLACLGAGSCVFGPRSEIPARRSLRSSGCRTIGEPGEVDEGSSLLHSHPFGPPVPQVPPRVPSQRGGDGAVPEPCEYPREALLHRVRQSLRHPHRSHREEAPLPFSPLLAGVFDCGGRVQPPLPQLPELGDLADESPRDGERRPDAGERRRRNASGRGATPIAYTYSEPVTFYEYAFDTSALAHRKKIRNILKSSGYINEAPLRKLCKVWTPRTSTSRASTTTSTSN